MPNRDGVREVIDIVRPYLKPAREWLTLPAAAVVEATHGEQPAEADGWTDAASGEREQEHGVHVHDIGDGADDSTLREREQIAYGRRQPDHELEVTIA